LGVCFNKVTQEFDVMAQTFLRFPLCTGFCEEKFSDLDRIDFGVPLNFTLIKLTEFIFSN
jgi:hypothetical protein